MPDAIQSIHNGRLESPLELFSTDGSLQGFKLNGVPAAAFATLLLLQSDAASFRTAIGVLSNFSGNYADLVGIPSTFAPSAHTHPQSEVTNLITDLLAKVPTTRTVNGYALSSNIVLSTADLADSLNKRFVTDALLTILQNTSGTNTGDQNLAPYALLASPAFSGNPTVPNQSPGTNNTRAANTAYVDAAIAALLASAPGVLDTLDEIASALGDDPNFATTITTALATKLVKTANLSDLADAAIALANLGLSANGRSLVTAADYAEMRTLLGLTALATLTPAAGIATFLGTPTLANLKSAITDETTVGWNLLTLPDPGAIRFIQLNANNTVTVQDAATQRAAIGAAASSHTHAQSEVTNLTADLASKADKTLEAVSAATLGNSWVNYGGSFTAAGYWKDPFGVVHLQGFIKDGVTTVGTVIFTLPVGYRPALATYFHVVNSGGTGEILVEAGGAVKMNAGGNSYLSLNGIYFRTT